ncbi:MAG: flagellar motor protein MotB [Magnetospiraceae bacterium]
MTEASKPQPIIKKVKKVSGGHHGGAWKVAYADFVTAMMAFFLLLWLLNAVTQEQLEGIADYFAPVSIIEGPVGDDTILAQRPQIIRVPLPTPTLGAEVAQDEKPPAEETPPEETPPEIADPQTPPKDLEITEQAPEIEEVTEPDAERIAQELQEQQFEEVKRELAEIIQASPALAALNDSLIVDNTPEGVRIQIVDQEGFAMFPRGSADMYERTRKLFEAVAEVVNKVPQNISISGYTDAVKFAEPAGYSNWELSADRANASRRALVEMGVESDRIKRVSGLAETDPFLPDDPTNPKNRRIAVILLRESPNQMP